jgi:hypothetical protein
MKKYAALAAVIALTGQTVSPAFAAGVFNDTTMLGWKRTSEPAAVAYFKMPFQSGPGLKAQPRVGLMISSPRSYSASTAIVHQAGSGVVDLGFTGRDFYSPWTATLNFNNQVAWASNPDALPKNTKYFLESGTSWALVGVASAAIIAGVILASEN